MCFYIYMLISKFKFIFIFIWIYIILYRMMLDDIIYIHSHACTQSILFTIHDIYLTIQLSVPAGSPSPLPSAEMKRSQSMPSAQLKHIGSRGSQRWWNDQQLWMGRGQRNPAAVHGLSHVYPIIYRLSTIHHYKFGGMEVSIVVGVPQ